MGAAPAQQRRIKLPPLHPYQYQIYDQMQRFSIAVCHRRFGKTFFGLLVLLARCLSNPRQAPRYAYLAPYYKQAKTIAWDMLRTLALQIPGTKCNEAELRAILPGNREIRLLGADNPDALRGMYLDGAVLDEYALMRSSVWESVIRPTLADRQGFALFIGTPLGENHFHELYTAAAGLADWHTVILRASETGIIPSHELASMRETMGVDAYNRELECSWVAAIPGAYFAEEFKALDAEGRIKAVDVHPHLPVQTAWDLGRNDANAIWFFQQVGSWVHFLEYVEGSNIALCPDPRNPASPSWISTVRERGYLYDQSLAFPPLSRDPYEVHYGPHDLEVHEYSSNKTRYGLALDAGLRFSVLPPCRSLSDDIESSRQLLRRSVFDAARCKDGLRALRNYQREYDEEKQVFADRPLHNWASHGADAFRHAAVGLRGLPRPTEVSAPGGSFEYWRQQVKRLKQGSALRTYRVGDGRG